MSSLPASIHVDPEAQKKAVTLVQAERRGDSQKHQQFDYHKFTEIEN